MAALQTVRVFATWIDDPTECVLTIDLAKDPQTHAALGHWDVMGAVDLASQARRPFVLSADGKMDFGSQTPDAERFWHTDLRKHPLIAGQKFQIEWPHNDIGHYVIEKVAVLGSKIAQERHDSID